MSQPSCAIRLQEYSESGQRHVSEAKSLCLNTAFRTIVILVGIVLDWSKLVTLQTITNTGTPTVLAHLFVRHTGEASMPS